MNCAQVLPQEDAAMCWRCGTEVDEWLQVLPIPRATETVWCIHCYIEVHARLDDDSSTRRSVTVEVDIYLLLYVATTQLPKVVDRFGTRYAPRMISGRWELEGGDIPVPTTELERLRHWWPQLMRRWERM